MKGKLLLKAFTLCGMAGVMTACYGTPYREYGVQGSVTDVDSGTPIKGIKVTPNDEGYENHSYSNEYGQVHIYTDSDRIINSAKDIVVEDVDGTLNGGYFTPHSAVISSDGTYIDIYMKLSEEQPHNE